MAVHPAQRKAQPLLLGWAGGAEMQARRCGRMWLGEDKPAALLTTSNGAGHLSLQPLPTHTRTLLLACSSACGSQRSGYMCAQAKSIAGEPQSVAKSQPLPAQLYGLVRSASSGVEGPRKPSTSCEGAK